MAQLVFLILPNVSDVEHIFRRFLQSVVEWLAPVFWVLLGQGVKLMSEANVEHLTQSPSICYMQSSSLDVSAVHPQAWEISRETRMQPKNFGCRWGNTAKRNAFTACLARYMGVCKWCWLYIIDRWIYLHTFTHLYQTNHGSSWVTNLKICHLRIHINDRPHFSRWTKTGTQNGE